MNEMDFQEEREVKKPGDKVPRSPWFIWCGLVVIGAMVAVVSPMLLLLVLVIACLMLSSRLPYAVRGMFIPAPFTRNVTKRKRPDHDD
ncbi:MAG: hypothetical protein P4N60_09920 [Verrucomicrobiae bacterium]|nr:hypothetical protein [Verrucomicrobiae bacterium]